MAPIQEKVAADANLTPSMAGLAPGRAHRRLTVVGATHEGYPCVFWQDFYTWDLAQEANRSGIAALIRVHENHAGGTSSVLHVDDDLYVMQRNGWGTQRGLIFVLNNRADWHGTWVQTKWASERFAPAAWRGRADLGVPDPKWSDGNGWAEFWAPPRGYAVYIPGT